MPRSHESTALLSLLVILTVAWISCGPAQAQKPTEVPWTVDQMKEALQVGFKTMYSFAGTDDDGVEVSGTHSFEVVDAGEKVVSIDAVHKEGGSTGTAHDSVRWEDALFMETFSDPEVEIVGTEEVTTPAGTFETVVVKARRDLGGWRQQTYWMIPDQPGVYARFVDYGKDDEPTEIVYTLEEITPPGS